ncbi:MAG: hypothetical protein AAGA03_02745 [Planctomycetota bacterium]
MNVLVPTKQLVINAAFLQEIKDSNQDLWLVLSAIRGTCQLQDEPIAVLRLLIEQLDQLRDLLAFQFTLEESYGWIEVERPASGLPPEQSAPSIAPSELPNQHCALYLDVSDLVEQAEELQYRGVNLMALKTLLESTIRFDAKLREHEALEQELIVAGLPTGTT